MAETMNDVADPNKQQSLQKPTQPQKEVADKHGIRESPANLSKIPAKKEAFAKAGKKTVSTGNHKKPEASGTLPPKKPDQATNKVSAEKQSLPSKKPSPNTKYEKNKKRPFRRIVERTDTISGVYYRQMRQRIQRMKIRNLFILLVIIVMGIWGLVLFADDRARMRHILMAGSTGLELLEADDLQQAEFQFDKALSMYKTYHITNPDLWWYADSYLFTTMLRVGQGYRSLGLYQKAIDAFFTVSLHNTHGCDSWVGRIMQKEMFEFIHPSHWDEEQMAEIHAYLLSLSLQDWHPNTLFLIQLIERSGLHVMSIAERLEKSDFAMLGAIRSADMEASQMVVDGFNYYLIDNHPGEITLALPVLNAQDQSRLLWYANSNRECIFFATYQDNQPALWGIDGILLNEGYAAEPFNQALLKISQ
jgi:hypothetical protein